MGEREGCRTVLRADGSAQSDVSINYYLLDACEASAVISLHRL